MQNVLRDLVGLGIFTLLYLAAVAHAGGPFRFIVLIFGGLGIGALWLGFFLRLSDSAGKGTGRGETQNAHAPLGAEVKSAPDIPPQNIPATIYDPLDEAQRGNADAHWEMAAQYLYGQVVYKDLRRAVVWLKRTADNNHHSALSERAGLYSSDSEVKPNRREAFQSFHAGAEIGNPICRNNLGQFYYDGIGTSPDFDEALHWLRLAAEQGHAGAARNLGFYYCEGKALPPDLNESMRWFEKAVSLGDDLSRQDLDEVRRYLYQSTE